MMHFRFIYDTGLHDIRKEMTAIYIAIFAIYIFCLFLFCFLSFISACDTRSWCTFFSFLCIWCHFPTFLRVALITHVNTVTFMKLTSLKPLHEEMKKSEFYLVTEGRRLRSAWTASSHNPSVWCRLQDQTQREHFTSFNLLFHHF